MARPMSHANEVANFASAATGMSRHVATQHDMSSPDAAFIQQNSAATPNDEPRQSAPTRDDTPRPVATGPAQPAAGVLKREEPAIVEDRYVKLLERENDFLRSQVDTKDGQIKELTERSRETNMLVAGLQKMLSPLLGTGRTDTHDLGR